MFCSGSKVFCELLKILKCNAIISYFILKYEFRQWDKTNSNTNKSNKAIRIIPFPENRRLIFFYIYTTSNAQLWNLNITAFYGKLLIIVICCRLIQKFRGRISKPIFVILYSKIRSIVFLFLHFKHWTCCRIINISHIIIMF